MLGCQNHLAGKEKQPNILLSDPFCPPTALLATLLGHLVGICIFEAVFISFGQN